MIEYLYMPMNFAQAVNKCNGVRGFQVQVHIVYEIYKILLNGHISENDIRVRILQSRIQGVVLGKGERN